MSRGVGYVVDTGVSGGAVTQNILVIDDNEETCEFLTEILERHGYAVRTARDGGQAHSTFAMYKPDLVLLDRLTHHCHIVETGNDSYRFRHSSSTAKARSKSREQAKTQAKEDADEPF